MSKKYWSVIQKSRDSGLNRLRVASFAQESDAISLSERLNRNNTQRELTYEHVWSDVFENLEEYLDYEAIQLIESAKSKLTADEWQAVTSVRKLSQQNDALTAWEFQQVPSL